MLSALTPDYDAVIDILRWMNPLGPWWSLTAISTNQKGTFTSTFGTDEEAAIRAWLFEHNEKLHRSVYFTLNSVSERVNVKPSREKIAEMRWVHVDLDPRRGESVAAEQVRLHELVTSNRPRGLPNPSLVVFSGGGYQMFWRLREAIKIRDLAHAEELKRHNLQIEIVLGGDSCHNIDRLMRLPGTINWLTKKKIEAGRTPTLAHVVERHDDRIYDINNFPPAPLIQTSAAGLVSTAPSVQVSANIRRLLSVDELPKEVEDLAKVVIVQGNDPDNPDRWKSRSEAVWYVACELARAEVDDDTFFSVLTDPSFAISAHVLEQKNSDGYAKRTIERAREFAIDPNLATMNERHAVISDIGGSCRIISEIYDHSLDRIRISKQRFLDFENRYCNEKISVAGPKGPVQVPLGKWWIHHPKRRQYETIVFAPGKEIPQAYNLWRGFACKAIPGNCSLFLNHIKQVICSGIDTYYQYLIRWMARAVQTPGSQGQVAVVLKGPMGVGKGFFAKHFGALFGRHYVPVSDPKHLTGSFNAHLSDCVILFADEAFYAGDKKHESVLKALVTEDTLSIEAKGVDVGTQKSCVHLIMASNETWAVPVGLDDRRFFILTVDDRERGNQPYFLAIDEQLHAGGYEALLDFLLKISLVGWDVRSRPKTEALLAEKLNSLSPEFDWWYSCLREGRIVFEDISWPSYVIIDALHSALLRHTRNWSKHQSRSGKTRLGIFLKQVIPNGGPVHKRMMGTHHYINELGQEVAKTNPNIYQMPTLGACREHWVKRFGILEPWPAEDMEVAQSINYEAVLR